MMSKDQIESIDSMGEWSLLDSSEENEQSCEKKSSKIIEANLDEDKDIDSPKLETLKPETFVNDESKDTKAEDKCKFYKSNLDSISRIGLLMILTLYLFSVIHYRSGDESDYLDGVKGSDYFTKMNPTQIQRYLNDDNDLYKRLIEELKKTKTEPFLITGKEGKKSQSVRSLLNDLIINSEKLVSLLVELRLEDFSAAENTLIKPLLTDNLKIRTDYFRRKCLEGDFEGLKNSLIHWNEKYAKLRLEVVNKYTQVKQEDVKDQTSHAAERDVKITEKFDDQLSKKAEDLVKNIISTETPNIVKTNVHLDQRNIPKDGKTNQIKNKDDATKTLTNVIDKTKSDIKFQPNLVGDTHPNIFGKDHNKFQSWEKLLIRKIAKAYSDILDVTTQDLRGDKIKIELEISDKIGQQLLKQNQKRSDSLRKPQPTNVSQKKVKKNTKTLPSTKDDLQSEKIKKVKNKSSITESYQNIKNIPKKKRKSQDIDADIKKTNEPYLKETRKIEKKDILKKKFATKKPDKIDDGTYYKGEYNKINNKNTPSDESKCKGVDCKINQHADDDEDDEKTEVVAPYLKRGKKEKKPEITGLKKHWQNPELKKHFRQPSANPKKQFIPRSA